MELDTTITLICFTTTLVTAGAWDTARRFLKTSTTSAKQDLDLLVQRHEAATERNEAALTEFLRQVADMVRYAERQRREAEGTAFTNSQRRR